MPRSLTTEAIERGARALGCSVPALRAVLSVEALGSGFFADGRPKILFERHKFHQLTSGRFDASHPGVSNPVAGGYAGGASEYPRLYEAIQLDAEAAVLSTSWGIGQVMGFNWSAAGEKSLLGFLLAAHNNEESQLGLMIGFIRSQGLAKYLEARDWAGFAKGYNGTGYARNRYDEKLRVAYLSFGGK